MPAGLSGGVTITSTFVANAATSPVTPASSATCIDVSSAVASTSPGAPSAACSARSVLEPKENVDVGVVLALELRGQVLVDVGQRGRREHRELAAARPRRTAAAPAGGERQDQQQDGQGCAAASHQGLSTTTLVDFTETMARTPGSSPSSSAASALISETIR